eukprot:2375341-Amphidinium_carterae.1
MTTGNEEDFDYDQEDAFAFLPIRLQIYGHRRFLQRQKYHRYTTVGHRGSNSRHQSRTGMT